MTTWISQNQNPQVVPKSKAEVSRLSAKVEVCLHSNDTQKAKTHAAEMCETCRSCSQGNLAGFKNTGAQHGNVSRNVFDHLETENPNCYIYSRRPSSGAKRDVDIKHPLKDKHDTRVTKNKAWIEFCEGGVMMESSFLSVSHRIMKFNKYKSNIESNIVVVWCISGYRSG